MTTCGLRHFLKLQQNTISTWKSHYSAISPSNPAPQILQIPSYALRVRATDNGHPAQFSDVPVHIHVSDVNDNPPRFFQLNYSVVVQVSQETVCSPSLCTKELIPRLLLEQSGETLMKQAAALCSVCSRAGVGFVFLFLILGHFSLLTFLQQHLSPFQENAPVGTSVLELIMSDRDSPENGPPYSFQITQGNDGKAFEVTQNGLLVTSSVLNRRMKEQYLLQVQVEPVLLSWCLNSPASLSSNKMWLPWPSWMKTSLALKKSNPGTNFAAWSQLQSSILHTVCPQEAGGQLLCW